MADTTVLAGRRLVLEHHIEMGAISLVAVGSTDQVDHLVALDRTGAREHRIRADAGQVVDFKGQYLSFGAGGDACLDAVLAGVDVAHKRFETVGDEFHRALEHDAQGDGREIVRISMHLDTERAADILANDPDRAFRQIELARIQVLHHVRRLLRVIHRQARVAGMPVGDLAARFERHAGVSAKMKRGLGHHRRTGEGFIDAAGIQIAGEAQVVAQARMQHHGVGRQRGLHVGQGRQRFPFHLQVLQRILGFSAGVGDDRHHRFALPAGAVQRQRILRRRLHAGQMRQCRHPRLADFGHLMAVDDSDHARHHARVIAIDRNNAGMRDRTAPVHHMRHARQVDIVQILATAFEQAACAAAHHRFADVALVVGQRRQAGDGLVGRVHAEAPVACTVAPAPARLASTSAIASTIAW